MNHSDFSNQSFLPLSPTLIGCNPLKPEIGKEDIRFPAFAFGGKPIKRNNPAKLVFGLKREESALAECPITGIILSIGIPALPFSLTYENPIAKEKNARKIAALPISELQTFENDILAGTFLSLLSANALIEDRKTGLERNNLLCQHYSSEQLITFLGITSKVLNHFSKPEKLKRFVEESPKLCLDDFADNIQPTVEGWLSSITPAVSKTIINEAEEEKSAKLRLKQAVQIRQSRENISLSLRSKIKALALELGKQEVISQKASSIFQFLGTGQNWKTLTKDSKVSYIAYLSEKLISSADGTEEEQVETLITLLREIPVLDTYRVLVEEEETPSSIVVPSVKKPLTLSQRLEAIALAKSNKAGKGN
jgi:hypothetical protein